MELQIPTFTSLFTLCLFMFMVLKLVKRAKTNESTSNLPPGPWKLPLIGNMHQFIGSLPHHALRDLAKQHGPLLHIRLGEISTVIVSSPEIAKEVMKTNDIIFASRPEFMGGRLVLYDDTNDIIFAPYGDYWRTLRKICTSELLTAQRVQSFRSIRQEEVSNLIKALYLKTGSSINLSEKIFSLTPDITSRAAFGKKCKDQEAFISVLKEILQFAPGFNVADVFPSLELLYVISGVRSKFKKMHKKVDRILENIINDHKAGKGTKKTGEGEINDDLVDVLLKFQNNGDREISLTTNNIKAIILDIFGAGTETSSTVVDWAMAEMLKNPRVMEKAQAEVRQVFGRSGNVDEGGIQELKYLKLVIKETLRLHPPAPLLIPRECRERCVINGYEIPAKTNVMVNAWAIGRDPNYWSDAERFYPERFLDSSVDYKGTNFEYIPFGAGRRICPGITFGLANVELPLAQLLYHFDWELPHGMKQENLDMTEEFGITVRRKEELHLIPIAYHPLSPVE